MSDSSQELQDEIPRRKQRYFIVASLGTTFAKPGEQIHKMYGAALNSSRMRNANRALGHLRKKKVAPTCAVFVLYVQRAKDAHWGGGVWSLLRRTRIHPMDADDVFAFAIEDAMMSG